jgi:hypothetical protein
MAILPPTYVGPVPGEHAVSVDEGQVFSTQSIDFPGLMQPRIDAAGSAIQSFHEIITSLHA